MLVLSLDQWCSASYCMQRLVSRPAGFGSVLVPSWVDNSENILDRCRLEFGSVCWLVRPWRGWSNAALKLLASFAAVCCAIQQSSPTFDVPSSFAPCGVCNCEEPGCPTGHLDWSGSRPGRTAFPTLQCSTLLSTAGARILEDHNRHRRLNCVLSSRILPFFRGVGPNESWQYAH